MIEFPSDVERILYVAHYILYAGICYYVVFFFFQAEDGIRDGTVTEVQTCALPISEVVAGRTIGRGRVQKPIDVVGAVRASISLSRSRAMSNSVVTTLDITQLDISGKNSRSEERRVGKGVDLGGGRIIEKKRRRQSE